MQNTYVILATINGVMLFVIIIWNISLLATSIQDINYQVAFSLNQHFQSATSIISVSFCIILSQFITQLVKNSGNHLYKTIIKQIVILLCLGILMGITIFLQIIIPNEVKQNFKFIGSMILLQSLSILSPLAYIIVFYFQRLHKQICNKFFTISLFIALTLAVTLFISLPYLIPMLSSIVNDVMQQNKIDPVVIADRGNSHLAAENTVESILAIAKRMYAKKTSFDLELTRDLRLVGSKSNQIQINGKQVTIQLSNLVELKSIEIGKNWLRIDPYGTYQLSRMQQKSYSEYIEEARNYAERVENSTINTANELVGTCVRYLIPLLLNINYDLRTLEQANAIVDVLDEFGLVSIDQSNLIMIKTSDFKLYEQLVCKYPFLEFTLPIYAFVEDWDNKLVCTQQIPYIKATVKTIFGYLNNYYLMREIKNVKNVEIQLLGANSRTIVCIAKFLSIDYITTNLESQDLESSCTIIGYIVAYYTLCIIGIIISTVIFVIQLRQYGQANKKIQ